jgi:hypothetical protein
VLDTLGLNALGTEPELTLSMIPNAYAVLFLLAMDTGVTKSDPRGMAEIRAARGHPPHRGAEQDRPDVG